MLQLLLAGLVAIGPAVVAKIMAVLGFAIFSYAGLNLLLNNYLDQMTSATGQIGGVVHALLNIAGFDQILTILGSAFLTRLSLLALKRIQMV